MFCCNRKLQQTGIEEWRWDLDMFCKHVVGVTVVFAYSTNFSSFKCTQGRQTIDWPFSPPSISKLLHKILLETSRPPRPPCSLPQVHSRTRLLLQVPRLFGPRHPTATVPSCSHSLSTTNGLLLGYLLRISLTKAGEGKMTFFFQFDCKSVYCMDK